MTCGLENTWGKSKIELYTCARRQPVMLSDRREGSVTWAVIMVEGEYVLTFVVKVASAGVHSYTY